MEKQNIPEQLIAEKLKEKGITLAVAESCTGGLISHRVTNIPGSSEYFKGGVVAYSNEVKTLLLYVSPDILEKHGAVSSQVAKAMAKGARTVLGANIAVAITGIAGPAGGSKTKPVGLAFLAIAFSDDDIHTKKVIVEGERESLKEQFADEALDLVLKNI
ncbi:MAG: CinA family protein [Candidatus Omnitrophota bacterium]|jgi:nicotinamide-nucleotide amidase